MITKNPNRIRNIVSLAVVTIILISAVAYLVLNANQGSHPLSTANPSGSGSLAPSNQSGHALVLTGAGASNQAVSGDPAGSGNLTRTISVSGTGQVSFTPDEALIDASVVTVATTAGAATAQNAATTLGVIRALNSIGIANSSMQTTGYTLSPSYNNNYGSAQPPQILGFTVTNSLRVNVTGTGSDQLGLKTGQVIDTVVKAGANQVSLQFTASNHELAVLNNEALRQAVLSASSQARTIADALGVSITGVLTASEGYSYSPQSYSGLGAVFAETATAVLTPIVPNSMTATATVQVTYTIS